MFRAGSEELKACPEHVEGDSNLLWSYLKVHSDGYKIMVTR
jgi:hypothetical protein